MWSLSIITLKSMVTGVASPTSVLPMSSAPEVWHVAQSDGSRNRPSCMRKRSWQALQLPTATTSCLEREAVLRPKSNVVLFASGWT